MEVKTTLSLVCAKYYIVLDETRACSWFVCRFLLILLLWGSYFLVSALMNSLRFYQKIRSAAYTKRAKTEFTLPSKFAT